MAKKKYYGDKGGMISSDYTAHANLPQDVVMKDYPELGYGQNELLDDTISGIDNQMKDDMTGGKRKKGKYPEKY